MKSAVPDADLLAALSLDDKVRLLAGAEGPVAIRLGVTPAPDHDAMIGRRPRALAPSLAADGGLGVTVALRNTAGGPAAR